MKSAEVLVDDLSTKKTTGTTSCSSETKQTETLVFVHDTPAAQSARYAEVRD